MARPHDFSATAPNCWCDPHLMIRCEVCDQQSKDCWKCEGDGLVPWDGVSTESVTVRHRYSGDT